MKRPLRTCLLIALSFLSSEQVLLAATKSSQPDCQGLAKDETSWKVFLAVTKGRLSVDQKQTSGTLSPSPLFKCRARIGDNDAARVKAIERQLISDLDALLVQLRPLYESSLQDDEENNPPTDELTKSLLLDYTWEAFKLKYAEWVAAGAGAGKNRISLKRIFSPSEVLRQLTALRFSTPMLFVPEDTPRPYSFDQGSITVQVTDPIGDWRSEEDYDLSFPNIGNPNLANERRDAIISQLSSLRGELWRPTLIKQRIEEYYSYRGLQATVSVKRVGSKAVIEIYESPRVARILFHKDVPGDEYAKILYVLLPYKYFRSYLLNAPALSELKATEELPDGTEVQQVLYRALDYCDLYQCNRDEPYINQFSFQIQQLELSELGFVASQSETPRDVRADTQSDVNSYIDLIILKADKESGETKNKPAAQRSAPLTANEEGVARSRPEAASDQTRSEMVTPAPILGGPTRDGMKKEEDNSWVPKEKTKFIGFGIESSPGQNVRFYGIYQQSKIGLLSSDDSLSVKAGAQESGLAGVNYFADYVLFNRLKKRLTLQFTGSSDFQANRLFSGVATDERRTGGLARGELEIFRNRRGGLLRVFAEGRRATVTLTRNDTTLNKVNLTSVELGGVFLAGTRTAFRPKQFKLDFRVRLGLPQKEADYAVHSLNANYHQLLTHFLETDISGRVELASKSTLEFDRPSFGGAEVVRGFRHDDLIGQRLWSIQPELWFPVPGVNGSDKGLSKLLERNVRLAGFVDAGGVYRTGTTKDGVKFGPGLGARFIFFPIIMKLDWAYGIGETATGKGHGRFYFTVGTNLPF